jgi:hypothetical protein
MNKKNNIDVINSLITSINEKNLEAMDKLFSEDVIIEWPQSGERIVGNSNRREIYNRFPSLPSVKLSRINGIGNIYILEAELNYGNDDKYQSVFIFELENGFIKKEIAYWSKPFPAPNWRKPWVEKIIQY